MIELGRSKQVTQAGAALCLGIASSPSDLVRIGTLRDRSYRSAGVSLETNGIFVDRFDGLQSSILFAATRDGTPIGSIRAISLQPQADRLAEGPTFLQAFGSEVEARLGFNAPIVESNRFVTDPDLGALGLRVTSLLFRGIYLTALHLSAAWIVTAVRPEHSRFYAKLFGFEPISAPKPYPGLGVDMALHAVAVGETERQRVERRLPELRIEEADMEEFRQCLSRLH